MLSEFYYLSCNYGYGYRQIMKLLPFIWALPAFSVTAYAAEPIRINASPLTQCLGQIAQATGARFIVSENLTKTLPACRNVENAQSIAKALDAIVDGTNVRWQQRDDGVFMLAAQTSFEQAQLAPLYIEASSGSVAESETEKNVPLPSVEQWRSKTHYDASELAVKPVFQFNQLSRLAPNVYSNGESLSIRGVPRDNNYFTGNTVFYDGIDVGTLLLDNNLLAVQDLESLSYARGGNALLQGSGAAGGAIYLTTPNPVPKWGGSVSTSLGQRNANSNSLTITRPILDFGLSGRLYLGQSEDPRFVRNVVISEISGSTDTRQRANAKLLFEPEFWPGFTLGMTSFYIGGDAPDRFVARRSQESLDSIFDEISFDNTAMNWNISAIGQGLNARYVTDRGVEIAALASNSRIGNSEMHQSEGRGNEERRQRFQTTLSVPFADYWKAYLGFERQQVKDEQWAQSQYLPQRPFTSEGFNQRRTNGLRMGNTSLVAELSYDSGALWQASIGARSVEEDVYFFLSQYSVYESRPPVLELPYATRARYSKVLPVASVAFNFNNHHTLSLKYDQAYRMGGGGHNYITGYQPEQLQTIELGWHGKWFDERIQTQLNVFETDWNKRTSIDGTIGSSIHVPLETQIRGAEFQVQAQLNDLWSMRAGLGWLDSTYRQGVFATEGHILDLAGLRAADAPRFTVSAGVIGQLGSGWYVAADAYHASSAVSAVMYGRHESSAVLPVRPGYSVVDARLGWRGKTLDVSINASNVFDAKYIDHYDDLKPFSRFIGEPRQIDFRLSWQW
jgi:hypothetical protein